MNFRPHGPEPCDTRTRDESQQEDASRVLPACTGACTGQAAVLSVEGLADALLGLSAGDRAKLVALLLAR